MSSRNIDMSEARDPRDPDGADLITPGEFERRYPTWKTDGITAICPRCHKKVIPHAVDSLAITASFYHAKGESCLPEQSRLGYIRNAEESLAQKAQIIAELQHGDAGLRVYARCHELCGTLSCKEFSEMCEQANRERIWQKKGNDTGGGPVCHRHHDDSSEDCEA